MQFFLYFIHINSVAHRLCDSECKYMHATLTNNQFTTSIYIYINQNQYKINIKQVATASGGNGGKDGNSGTDNALLLTHIMAS